VRVFLKLFFASLCRISFLWLKVIGSRPNEDLFPKLNYGLLIKCSAFCYFVATGRVSRLGNPSNESV